MARYAKKGSTRQDIIEKMLEFIRNDQEIDPEDFDATDEDQIICQYLSSMAYSDSQARKDLEKIDFDFENCEGATEGSRVLPDGTAIVWCWAGGDWEYPVHFVVYLDPSDKLRAYIPSDGNIYCHTCKCACGTCGEYEPCANQEWSDKMLDEQPDPDWSKMQADVVKRIQTK